MTPHAMQTWHNLHRAVIARHEAITAYNAATDPAEHARLLAEYVAHGDEARRLLYELVAEMSKAKAEA